MAGKTGPRVLFIGGLGRSGSTLLERILCELPGVCGMGEVVHLWQRGLVDDELCGCGEAFSSCPFWREVGDAAFGGWPAFDVAAFQTLKDSVDRTRFVPVLAGPALAAGLRRRVADHDEVYRRLYEAVRAVSGCEVLVDSSKHVSLACCLRWSEEIDLRILHVVRDARAVAYSWSKTVGRPEAVEGSAEGAYMARWSGRKTALHWNAQNLGFDVLARRGVPTLRVRYEDFMRSPAGTLREIAGFTGLDEAVSLPFDGDMAVRLTSNHQVAGNPMRFRSGRVELRADEAWKAELAAGQRRVVTGLTLPLLARYGYRRDA
jgi:Sulfotransferase family